MENLIYASIQCVHNIGAVLIVTAPLLWWQQARHGVAVHYYRQLALAGWTLQLFSGIGFAFASMRLHGQIPEVEGTAFAALAVKLLCVATAMAWLFYAWLWRSKQPAAAGTPWLVPLLAAVTALMAAGFLRWYL